VRAGRRRRGAAVANVLRRQLPEAAVHRAVGDGVRRAAGAKDGGVHPPPLLPRLLRQCTFLLARVPKTKQLSVLLHA
jgi:hypothetical protein